MLHSPLHQRPVPEFGGATTAIGPLKRIGQRSNDGQFFEVRQNGFGETRARVLNVVDERDLLSDCFAAAKGVAQTSTSSSALTFMSAVLCTLAFQVPRGGVVIR